MDAESSLGHYWVTVLLGIQEILHSDAVGLLAPCWSPEF